MVAENWTAYDKTPRMMLTVNSDIILNNQSKDSLATILIPYYSCKNNTLCV